MVRHAASTRPVCFRPAPQHNSPPDCSVPGRPQPGNFATAKAAFQLHCCPCLPTELLETDQQDLRNRTEHQTRPRWLHLLIPRGKPTRQVDPAGQRQSTANRHRNSQRRPKPVRRWSGAGTRTGAPSPRNWTGRSSSWRVLAWHARIATIFTALAPGACPDQPASRGHRAQLKALPPQLPTYLRRSSPLRGHLPASYGPNRLHSHAPDRGTLRIPLAYPPLRRREGPLGNHSKTANALLSDPQ